MALPHDMRSFHPDYWEEDKTEIKYIINSFLEGKELRPKDVKKMVQYIRHLELKIEQYKFKAKK